MRIYSYAKNRREKLAFTIESLSVLPLDHSILDFSNGIGSMNTYQVHNVARPYVTTHRLRFCSSRMPGRWFVWIVLGISMASSPSRLLSTAIDLKQADFIRDTAQPVDHRGICSSIIAVVIVMIFACKGTSSIEASSLTNKKSCTF